MVLEVLYNPNHAVILWFYDFTSCDNYNWENMNITLVQRIKVFPFFFISTRLQWFCALERAKNPIYKRRPRQVKLGGFWWFVGWFSHVKVAFWKLLQSMWSLSSQKLHFHCVTCNRVLVVTDKKWCLQNTDYKRVMVSHHSIMHSHWCLWKNHGRLNSCSFSMIQCWWDWGWHK